MLNTEVKTAGSISMFNASIITVLSCRERKRGADAPRVTKTT
jgi:hypothetical protein